MTTGTSGTFYFQPKPLLNYTPVYRVVRFGLLALGIITTAVAQNDGQNETLLDQGNFALLLNNNNSSFQVVENITLPLVRNWYYGDANEAGTIAGRVQRTRITHTLSKQSAIHFLGH